MDKYKLVLEILSNHKQNDSFVEAEDQMISNNQFFFKKDPKCLNSFIMKKLFTEKDSMSLILKGHLCLEVLLNDIIKVDSRCKHDKLNKILDDTFNHKIQFLQKRGVLEGTLYNDIHAINRYRNEFAHNFEYSICNLTIFKDFSLFKETHIKNKIRKVEIEAHYRFAIRYAFMYTFDRLYSKFDYLLALKKENKRASYHPLESNKIG